MRKLKIIATVIFLTLVGISTTSCFVRLHESHTDRGKHRGWFKNNNPRDHKIYIIKDDNHKYPKAKKQKKDSRDNRR